MSRTRLAAVVLAVAGVVGVAGVTRAQDAQQQPQQQQQQQDNNNQQQQGGGQRGFGRNFDPAQFQQRMMDNIKEQLGAKDDEWAVIQPRLEKVMTLNRDAQAGRMRGMFSRNRGGQDNGGNSNRPRGAFGGDPNSPVAKATESLRTALEDKSTSAETISEKLKTLRDARTQAKEELTKAQADLKEILSQRQEAQLVLMGMLE